MYSIIKPGERRVVPLPKGTEVLLEGGSNLPEYMISYAHKLRLMELESAFEGTNGVVTPVTFHEEVSRRQIVIRDGKITGTLQQSCYLLKKHRGQAGLENCKPVFTNEPRVVAVKRGKVKDWKDHLRFGRGRKYWVLEVRDRDELYTVPGGVLDGEHAKAVHPLDANGAAELWEETGISPKYVSGSIAFVSFEGDKGDVNFVWCGDADKEFTVSSVIAGFGEKQREETRCLLFVAVNHRAIRKLKKSGQNLWPNLIELLQQDLKRRRMETFWEWMQCYANMFGIH
jgi:8-oxo-dGTP pyrophosphatase MutT (NUDIX family)